jgi:hypothetical protein
MKKWLSFFRKKDYIKNGILPILSSLYSCKRFAYTLSCLEKKIRPIFGLNKKEFDYLIEALYFYGFIKIREEEVQEIILGRAALGPKVWEEKVVEFFPEKEFQTIKKQFVEITTKGQRFFHLIIK